MLDQSARENPSRFILQALSILGIMGCLLIFVVPLAMRSMTMADEGYLLLQSLDLANGKVLYRDMDAFVTPGVWFLLASVFKFAGPSVWVSRIPIIVAFLALTLVSYLITVRLTSRAWGFACIVLMMACCVWAFPAWTFSFYSPYSVLFGLAGLERLLAWHDGGRTRRDLIIAGTMFGLSILFKQNYGAFALAGAGLGLIALRVEADQGWWPAISGATLEGLQLAIGVALVGLPFMFYFGLHGALEAAFYSLVVHPFEFSGKHDIPYMDLGMIFAPDLMQSNTVEIMTYGAQPIYRTDSPGGMIDAVRVIERMHVLLYWIPPLIFIVGITLAFLPQEGAPQERERVRAPIDGRLLLLLSVAVFLFLGVFPRADFNHLINVYQPVVVAGVVVAHAVWTRTTGHWLRWLAAGSAGVVLALFCLIAGYWYHGLMIYLGTEVEGERGGVKVNIADAAMIHQLSRILEGSTEPGEALLTIPDISMLNFLTARPMPSPYYNLYEHHIAHDGGAGVVEGAEAHGVSIAVTRYNNFFSDRVGLEDYAPVLTRYLQTHFDQKFTVGKKGYVFLQRRPEPVPAETSESILDDCESASDRSEIEEHLIFRTLYQTTGPGSLYSEMTVQTRCEVWIPESGAELVTRIGYHHPIRIESPSMFRVQVVVVVGQHKRTVLERTIQVEPRGIRVNRFPAPPEYRIDLSAYAGHQVSLYMRTTRTGKVIMVPGPHRDFGLMWQDPRIVLRQEPAGPDGQERSAAAADDAPAGGAAAH